MSWAWCLPNLGTGNRRFGDLGTIWNDPDYGINLHRYYPQRLCKCLLSVWKEKLDYSLFNRNKLVWRTTILLVGQNLLKMMCKIWIYKRISFFQTVQLSLTHTFTYSHSRTWDCIGYSCNDCLFYSFGYVSLLIFS